MKKTNLFTELIAVIVFAGCTLEEPRAVGERCDDVSFVWPDETGGKLKTGDSETYDFYLNNRACPPDKPYCLMKKGFVHRGTVDENGEYQGDVVYPDEWYCSDRKESCPKGSHLAADGAQSYCEQDSALHCGSAENNCMDSAKGVDAAQCVDGQCQIQRCMQGFALINGECKSGAQCCGDYCQDCTQDEDKPLVCSADEYMSFGCDSFCMANMIDCYGVCVNPDSNLAFCGSTALNGVCTMNYCPDMEGWRDGSCTHGKCQVSECILGYHIAEDADGSHLCEADSAEVCGTGLTDCNLLPHVRDVVCERGMCIVKSCEDGFTRYDNECIEYVADSCEGVLCGPHALCDETTHLCKCEPGYADCDGECYDLQTSANHCGSCDKLCTTDKISHSAALACVEGDCVVSACEEGYHVELGRCTSNTCVNGTTDCVHSNGTGMVRTCENGEWGDLVACGDVSCNNNIENCGVCKNGAELCEDNVIKTCENGSWQNPVECNAGILPHGSEFACDTNKSKCVVKACESGYHLNEDENVCEKNDVNNCGAHGVKCDASVWANGTAFNCDNGTCKVTACAGGYQPNSNNKGCSVCDANLKVLVARESEILGSSTKLTPTSTIHVHYKQKVSGQTDPYGRQRYKVLFSYKRSENDNNLLPNDISRQWAYADYINVLTTVKQSVKVNWPSYLDLSGYAPIPVGCVDPVFGKAKLYNTSECKDSTLEKCVYNICCSGGCWGWFDNTLRGAFGAFESDLSMIPEC